MVKGIKEAISAAWLGALFPISQIYREKMMTKEMKEAVAAVWVHKNALGSLRAVALFDMNAHWRAPIIALVAFVALAF